MSTAKQYVIVGRARASAIFKHDQQYSLNYKFGEYPLARMVFQTRYLDKKLEHPVPEDLWVEIRCTANSIPEAVGIYLNAAREIASIFCIASNAHVDDLEAEIAFEVTDGVSQREFFQAFLPEQPITVVPGRLIDVAVVRSFVDSLVKHPERERLLRTIGHYQLALEHWTLGSEVLAIGQLFMAVENLKVAARRKHLLDRGIDDTVLAKEWGYDTNGTMKMAPYLDEQARVRLVFHGDADCHKSAKYVSDQFEHGLQNAGLLRPIAESVLAKTAEHVRNSIIEIANVAADSAATMQSNAYTRPSRLLKKSRGRP
jgi:hypothetical protein